MGPSRALSSVLILIGASCPWPGLSFDSIVGLSRTLSCKLLLFPVTEIMLISAVLHRDLDPEVGFSLVLRAGLRDLQKGWSNSSSSVYILIWGLQGLSLIHI